MYNSNFIVLLLYKHCYCVTYVDMFYVVDGVVQW